MNIKRLIQMCCSLLLTLEVLAQLPPEDDSYKLTFHDEFDSTEINSGKWKTNMSWNQSGYKDVSYCRNIDNGLISHEKYGYRKRNWDNVRTDTTGSGTITIVSKEEKYKGEVWNWYPCEHDSCHMGTGYHNCNNTHTPPKCWDVDSLWFNYTTNQLISKEEFRYGYFEIRCRIPVPDTPRTNTGIGPNFWLWDKDSSIMSEIDVFEFDGRNNHLISAIHFENADGDTLHGLKNHPDYIVVDDSEFHTYAAHWTPRKITFYFDGKAFVKTRKFADEMVSMPLIIDVNVPLHTMCQLIDTSHTQLPHHYEIDYVRVYQLKESEKTPKGNKIGWFSRVFGWL